MTRAVVVHPDADVLAHAVAARLLTRLLDLQSVRRPVHVVLTGGTVGIKSLAAMAASPLRDAVDWTGVHLWWGDERFLPEGDPDRNETQARDALITPLGDTLPERNVHPMAARDERVQSADRSAAEYCDELARFAPEGAASGPGGVAVPAFDVLLLGMGDEGHTASIFPESPAAHDERVAFGVHGCPKPPPTRVSLGFRAINEAREVWMVVAGTAKAPMVALALEGAGPVQVPAAGVAGRVQTLWLLDEEAASALPRSLRRG